MSTNYKVIDEKIIPSFTTNNKLAVVYIKLLREESGDAASAFSTSLTSSTGSVSNQKYAIMTSIPENNTISNFIPDIIAEKRCVHICSY